MSIDRIAALLAKSERTDNAAEAEAYLAKAQQLATLASIDLTVVRMHGTGAVRDVPVARTMTIGERGRRANPHLIALYVAIAFANDARVDVASNSTYVVGYGMASDLDVVEAMFATVAVQMVHSAQAFLAEGTWRDEHYVAVRARRRERRPHTAQTARAAFYRAYVTRIGERLTEARAQAIVQHDADAPGGGAESGALVLRRKSAQVDAFHRSTSAARGSWGGYSGAVRTPSGSASVAGRSAASRARLARQRELPGSGPALGS